MSSGATIGTGLSTPVGTDRSVPAGIGTLSPNLMAVDRVVRPQSPAVDRVVRPQSCGTPAVQLRDLGRMRYTPAFELQRELVEQRKSGAIPDQLLFVEHEPVVTLGRNAHMENVLADPDLLDRAGIELCSTDRGGDVTYHGPGQIVCYPIFDLREWKRDVVAYIRGIEEVLIGALSEFDIEARRVAGATGVWVSMPGGPAKIAAIGVHISRWVASHGFALNVDTDLTYFRYIVPCGLTQPVTSMRAVGSQAARNEVIPVLARHFARVFNREIMENGNLS